VHPSDLLLPICRLACVHLYASFIAPELLSALPVPSKVRAPKSMSIPLIQIVGDSQNFNRLYIRFIFDLDHEILADYPSC
jgi:hypothetical protein